MEHANLRGLGIEQCQLGPSVTQNPAHDRVSVHDSLHRRRRALDHEQQSHRLVDFDPLPGQPRTQIARRTIHHAKQRRDVVRQLGSAPPSWRIDVRKEVLKIDPLANRHHGPQDSRQDGTVLIVLRGIVRNQKRPAIKIQPAHAVPPPHEAHGIRRVAELGPRLRQILGAALDVPSRRRERKIQRRGVETPAALVGVALADHLQNLSRCLEIRHVRLGQQVEIIKRDRIVARVVQPAQKQRFGRHLQPSGGQEFGEPGGR